MTGRLVEQDDLQGPFQPKPFYDSAILKLHKAVSSPQTADRGDLTSPSLQLLTLHLWFQGQKEWNLLWVEQLVPVSGEDALFAALVWCSHMLALSQPLKQCQAGISPELYQDGFFSCSAVSEARNCAKWRKCSSSGHLFSNSHYSSHHLKSNRTPASFAREEVNYMGGQFSSWSTVNIWQLRSSWLAPLCTVAQQSHLRGHFGLRSPFCLGELILLCRYWANTCLSTQHFKLCIHHSLIGRVVWSTGRA